MDSAPLGGTLDSNDLNDRLAANIQVPQTDQKGASNPYSQNTLTNEHISQANGY